MSKIGVVIPVFGRFDLLQKCCNALPPDGVTIYIVDDCTPNEEEREQIRLFARDRRYRYFKNAENKGFPATVNKGVSKCGEEIFMILNSDVVLNSDAIQILLKEMSNPEVGVVAPMLVFPNDTEFGPAGKVQHVGIVFDILANPRHLFIGWSTTNPRVGVRRDDLQAVTGACFMTRKSLWQVIGGFAETYGRGTFEDIEYCLLVRYFKHKVVCNPAAIGTHAVSQSAKNNGGYPISQNQRIFMARVGQLLKNDDWRFL